MLYRIPAEHLHTAIACARPNTGTSHWAGLVTWGHALSFPSATSGNGAQVAEDEAGLQQRGSMRMLCVQRQTALLASLPATFAV